MPWILTITSRTRAMVNLVTGAPPDSSTVYDEGDLYYRIALAKQDPRDLVIEVRPISGTEA